MTGDKNRDDFKNQLGIILGFSEILLAEAAASDPRRPRWIIPLRKEPLEELTRGGADGT